MSATETVRQETEGGSSVKLIRNAKGDTQIEVKVRVDEEPGAVDAASAEAQRIYDALAAKYGGTA